jgi:hypothetical protein
MGGKRNQIEIGRVYGAWLVLTFSHKHTDSGKSFYECLCLICGIAKSVRPASKIINQNVGGCVDCCHWTHRTHGLSRTPLYVIAHGVQERITNPDCISFSSHGGRGIELYPGWHGPDGLIRMIRWLEENLPPWRPGLTLDRIDNNGNYEPGNLRWATVSQQANNRRSNRRITWRGRTQNLVEWSRERDIPRDTLAARIDSGWTLDRAMTKPVRQYGKKEA